MYIGIEHCQKVLEDLEVCEKCELQGEELKNCHCIQTGIEFDSELGIHRLAMKICPKWKAYDEQQRITKTLMGAGIGKRFASRTFENFEITAQTAYAYQACKRFCDTYTKESKGLLLVGDCGCGKTHLAAAVINRLLKKGICGILVTVPDLFAAIRKTFDQKNDPESLRMFDTVKNSELLVLDDLGSEKTGDWTKEVLYRLVNTRYENMLPTIITTNCDEGELISQVGGRVWSRMNEMCTGVRVEAPDYRRRKA